MARVTIAALSTENAQLRALLASEIESNTQTLEANEKLRVEIEAFKHQAKCDRRTILMIKSQVPARATVNSRSDAIKRYFEANPGKTTVSHADLVAFAAQ